MTAVPQPRAEAAEARSTPEACVVWLHQHHPVFSVIATTARAGYTGRPRSTAAGGRAGYGSRVVHRPRQPAAGRAGPSRLVRGRAGAAPRPVGHVGQEVAAAPTGCAAGPRAGSAQPV